MKEEFKLAINRAVSGHAPDFADFELPLAFSVKAFHESFPMYQKTPLVNLTNTAKAIGLKDIYVKDESFRFGLNAFKVLGGSYAIGRTIAKRLDMHFNEITYEKIMDEETRRKIGDVTFVTATDGNHGRGVAWSANRFGYKSVVYMPKGTEEIRLQNILKENADASITEFNYDGCVRLASQMAQEKGWIMVQDTAWDGYEEVPLWIMQGYTTMAIEAFEQMQEKPTHIFLQAGVGSMAAAVAAFFSDIYKEDMPKIVIVEPNRADCFYQTALAGDGERRIVTGDMNTIMAGLACGEPCSIAWDILSRCAKFYISCPEYAAAQGMRVLGNPAKGDKKVISGESGASAFGCVFEIMRDERLKDIRNEIGLDENSVCLFISTEGDTDPENYRRIVWDGAHPAER